VTTRRIGSFLACLVVVSLAAGPIAHADKKRSLAFYKLGKEQYKQEKFKLALSNFLAAYKEHNAPAYLFNIAQAQRQLGNCPEALDHYQQFLAEDPNTKIAKVVDKHIRALYEECGSRSAAKKPPEPIVTNHGHDINGENSTTVKIEKPITVKKQPTKLTGSPSKFATIAEAGAAFFNIGDVNVPVVADIRVGAAYRFMFGKIEIDAGISIDLSTISYEDVGTGTAALVTAVANVGVAYRVASKLRIRAEIGFGDSLFTGLDEGNPFTNDGRARSTAHMFTTRVGVGFSYLVTSRFGIHLSPLVLAASARNRKLASDIDSITRFAVLGGVVYAL